MWAYNINACPIDVDRFKTLLNGYPQHKYDEVVDIVQNGVKLHSLKVVDPNCPIPKHQASTLEHEQQVDEMLMKELKLKRIAGPFLKPPP